MSNDIILRAQDVHRFFPAGEGQLEILKGISLDIKKGEVISIVGPSGAGKSTLLHIMGLLDRPTAGQVYFNGQDIYAQSSGAQARIRNASFAFVFQFYHLISELDVLENTILPFYISHSIMGFMANNSGLKERGREILDKLGLSQRIHHRPGQLSGGEQQRVAIARALVSNPEIIFCDEPTGNLDSATSAEVQDLILELNRKEGKTFIIVTHEEKIAQKAHRIIRMVDGRII
ncbi:MAG: ABC transporter ATP-binding protein [Candidatus Brocadiia bacterium]